MAPNARHSSIYLSRVISSSEPFNCVEIRQPVHVLGRNKEAVFTAGCVEYELRGQRMSRVPRTTPCEVRTSRYAQNIGFVSNLRGMWYCDKGVGLLTVGTRDSGVYTP